MSPKDKVKKSVWRAGVAQDCGFITEIEVTEANTTLNHYNLIDAINTVSWES